MGAYAATLRRLLPVIAVAAVIGLSYMAPSSAFGASDFVGYGYGGNNCGVKGSGFHDHGKPCPNRPFPGHGNGVLRILHGALRAEEVTSETSTPGAPTTTKGHEKHQVPVATTSTTGVDMSSVASSAASSGSSSKGHKGHAKGNGRGRGHQPDNGEAGV